MDGVTNLANVVKYVPVKGAPLPHVALFHTGKDAAYFLRGASNMQRYGMVAVVARWFQLPILLVLHRNLLTLVFFFNTVMGLDSGIRCIRCKILLCYKKFEDSSELGVPNNSITTAIV